MADHDSLYHRLFQCPVMVEGLVRDFLPAAMAAGVEFDGMTRVVAKFHDRSGQRRDADIIWRLPLRQGSAVYLHLLLEFQSQSDWWMAVRTQVYEGLLWQQVIAEQELKAGDPLPPVLLVVLHNGRDRWSAPTDLVGMIGLPPHSPLWPWQPRIRYHVLDMARLPEDDLAGRDSLAALLVRLEQRHDPRTLAALVDRVIAWFRRHPGYEDVKRLFTELVRQAIAGVDARLAPPDELMEIRTMLSTLGETWKQEWLAEGRAEGRAEGKAEGKAEVLLRLAERRFGPIDPERRARILDADAATVDAWIDRLMEAASLEALLGPPH